MSAEKAGLKDRVVFKRPPKDDKKEIVQALQEADRRYQANRGALFGRGRTQINEEEVVEEQADPADSLQNVPKGISFARLYYPPNQSEIIVCGVNQRAVLHSSFVYDMLVDMQPECTFVQLPPDLPMFIKPQGGDYRSEWYGFVKYARDANFFVNPLPQYASDIEMSKARIEQLVDQTFRNTPDHFDISPKAIYSMGELRYDDNQVIPDAFLTPMLYTYNSLKDTEHNPRTIVIGDVPKLVQIEKWARALTIG